MKDKRLEVTLSVRGDGSLSRSSTRSSTRSNRSAGLPVSEYFAIDRFETPYHRAFEILDRYAPQRNQSQSLQALNRYEETRFSGRSTGSASGIAYNQFDPNSRLYVAPDGYIRDGYGYLYSSPGRYDTIAEHGSNTLPRSVQRAQDYPTATADVHYTLPNRRGPRRVRISENEATIHGYVKFKNTGVARSAADEASSGGGAAVVRRGPAPWLMTARIGGERHDSGS
ncbi:hypothetical protein EVAR_20045_1 [Eumeta japonica]|uniref:Uncharacterized protein n=1 Tax=Eumeta variegata TaxID=151549 RepID=A0A4C1UHU5_EUMVA|nr:hypothetical protein EVAR_20045_1 [Eumeta japonica]